MTKLFYTRSGKLVYNFHFILSKRIFIYVIWFEILYFINLIISEYKEIILLYIFWNPMKHIFHNYKYISIYLYRSKNNKILSI